MGYVDREPTCNNHGWLLDGFVLSTYSIALYSRLLVLYVNNHIL